MTIEGIYGRDPGPAFPNSGLSRADLRAERSSFRPNLERLACLPKTLARDLFGLGVIGLGVVAGYAIVGPESFRSLQNTVIGLLQRIPPLP